MKIAGIFISSTRQHKFTIPHSILNKLTGFLLFCLPFAAVLADPGIPAITVCAVASFSAMADICNQSKTID